MWVCPSCGRNVFGEAATCDSCGSPKGSGHGAPQIKSESNQSSAQRTSRRLRVILGVPLLIGAVAAGILYFYDPLGQKRSPPPKPTMVDSNLMTRVELAPGVTLGFLRANYALPITVGAAWRSRPTWVDEDHPSGEERVRIEGASMAMWETTSVGRAGIRLTSTVLTVMFPAGPPGDDPEIVQIRVGPGFQGSVLGLRIGETPDQITSKFGDFGDQSEVNEHGGRLQFRCDKILLNPYGDASLRKTLKLIHGWNLVWNNDSDHHVAVMNLWNNRYSLDRIGAGVERLVRNPYFIACPLD